MYNNTGGEIWGRSYQKNQCSNTNSLTWKDFGWKCMIQYFITPKQKSKLTAGSAPAGGEFEAAQADQVYIFWTCSIPPFWEDQDQEAGNIMSTILGLINVSFV